MATQTFKTTPTEIESYERAANASGLNKSAWMRVVLAVAAGVPFELDRDLIVNPPTRSTEYEPMEQTQSFRVTDAEIAAYEAASAAAFQKRSVWVRMVLAAASGLSDIPAQMARLANVQNKPVKDGEW